MASHSPFRSGTWLAKTRQWGARKSLDNEYQSPRCWSLSLAVIALRKRKFFGGAANEEWNSQGLQAVTQRESIHSFVLYGGTCESFSACSHGTQVVKAQKEPSKSPLSLLKPRRLSLFVIYKLQSTNQSRYRRERPTP